MLTQTPPSPDTHEPEDVPDPGLPDTLKAALRETVLPEPGPATADDFGQHEALLQGAVQYLGRKLEAQFDTYAKSLMKDLDDVCAYITQQLVIQKEQTQRAATLLDTLTTKAVADGIQLHQDAFTATAQVLSPSGIPLTFTVTQRSRDALLAEMPALIGWLKAQQFTAPSVPTY
jgi:hypothetical protein